jgi:hypothetical protein
MAEGTFDKIRNDMIVKWMSIPFGILVICCAGACYNLFAYFQQIGAAQGYNKDTLSLIKYVVLFGYYLGIIPGYLYRAVGDAFSFVIAAVMAIISFSVLGYLAVSDDSGTAHWVFMMIFLFTGAMSGGIATIGAIVIPVKSFPKESGLLIIVIMLSYYKIAPYLEFSFRSAFLEDPDLMYYFAGVGLFIACAFVLAAISIREVTLGDAIEGVIDRFDKMALLAYVLLAVIFFASFFVAALIIENWFIGIILFIAFLVANFFAVGAAFGVVYSRAKGAGAKALAGASKGGAEKKREEWSFEEMLRKGKYHAIVWSSMIIIGTCSTYSFNIFQTAFAFGQIDNADNFLDTFWAADMMGRIGGGILAFFMYQELKMNFYQYSVFASMIAVLGFGTVLLTEAVGAPAMFASTWMVGLASGMFWVIVPVIVMEDAGEKNFGLNWGLSLFANVLGMLIFGEFFDAIYEWKGDGQTCSGLGCVLIQFILFGLLALLAVGLCYYALSSDIEEGRGPKKVEKKNTTSKRDSSKSPKKRDSSKSKSKPKAASKKPRRGK